MAALRKKMCSYAKVMEIDGAEMLAACCDVGFRSPYDVYEGAPRA